MAHGNWLYASLLSTATLMIPFQASNAATMRISGSPAPTARVGKSYYFKPTLSNAKNNAAKFYIAGRPSWMSFSGSTGAMSGTPSANGTWGNIKITAWDGKQVAYIGPFKISTSGAVTAVKIAGAPAASTAAGAFFSFRPTVTAPSGATLSYSIANKPAWAAFNAGNGTLSGTPSTSNRGTYPSIGIRVTDGKTSASLAPFNITVSNAASGNALLSWAQPTKNTDGSSLTNLSGYHIHYGNAQSSLTKQLNIGNAGITSAFIEGLSRGTWYFAVVAYNSAGVESSMSPAASKTIY